MQLPYEDKGGAQRVITAVEGSLKRLGTDRLGPPSTHNAHY